MSELYDDRRLRAVIADDSSVYRGRFRGAAIAAGCEVVAEARSGAEALKKCLELKPDIAILDIAMPPGSGTATARELFEKKAVRVILVASSNSQDLAFKPLHDLGIRTITKPFGDPDFYATVKALCDGLD